MCSVTQKPWSLISSRRVFTIDYAKLLMKAGCYYIQLPSL